MSSNGGRAGHEKGKMVLQMKRFGVRRGEWATGTGFDDVGEVEDQRKEASKVMMMQWMMGNARAGNHQIIGLSVDELRGRQWLSVAQA